MGIKKYINDNKGMTLIDIAIALLVIGLLAAPIVGAINRANVIDPLNVAESNFNLVSKGIDDFYFENDRYPCPADPTLGPDDPRYGYERCDGVDWAGGGADNVLEGAVPFATLKIPEDASLDGFKRKLLYAVTLNQSDPAVIATILPAPPDGIPDTGAIVSNELQTVGHPTTFEDVCPDPSIPGLSPAQLIPTPTPSTHYMVLSHGDDAMGAYTVEGTLVEACDTASATPAVDVENCNGDEVFRRATCTTGNTNDENRFDDYVSAAFTQLPARIWENPDIATENTVSETALTGIADDNPMFEVDVTGNVKAEGDGILNSDVQGSALTGALCTNDISGDAPTTCFDPALITGTHPDMECSTTNAMTGISRNETICDVPYFAGNPITCPNGRYMAGICANGDPRCVDPDNPGATPPC